jgi:hypothetical protein
MVQVLDYWDLFVNNVFGGFWLAVFGILLLLFIIMGVLGRISIYSVTWYCLMFMLAMGLGYSYVIVNIVITLLLIIGVIFSWKGYTDRG